MEFRRITSLPPYVFTIIDGLKIEARRAGVDVIDLGFGNPDLPSPQTAVDKLCEAVHNSRNHRYSASRGIPKLRQAIADYYEKRFGVVLDPELVLIGGGLADVADLYLERTRTALAGEVFGGPVRNGTRLEVATLGSDAGVIGAALLAVPTPLPPFATR